MITPNLIDKSSWRLPLLPALVSTVLGSRAFACPKGNPLSLSSYNLNLALNLGSEAESQAMLTKVSEILFSPDEEPESPLNNALSLVMGSESSRIRRAQDILLRHLNDKQTRLVLLGGSEQVGSVDEGFQPGRGESIIENWVFSLVIPSLSDHIYWIVIPKKPQTPRSGYVYGFN